jgi:hypothetical protein
LAPRADEGRGKLRKAVGSRKLTLYPQISEWGNPAEMSTYSESIAVCGEPGELKHLSSRRKRKKFDFQSSGERNGKSPNPTSTEAGGCGLAYVISQTELKRLEKRAIEGDSPVSERM